ncbi:MAG: YfiR family protein [Bacteroidetes bacterium]|nr:YfiR family protein [Bacteroidota bacterium]
MISYRFQQPNNYDVNSKFKAVFIYNFTRYFDWPQQKKSGNFIIHVIGKNDNLISELKSLAAKKKVGNQPIEIKNTSIFENSGAQIYYIVGESSKALSDAVSKSKSKGGLVVAENTGSCKQGASINFVTVDNKLKFEYSKSNAIKAGLKTNDDFKALAINID